MYGAICGGRRDAPVDLAEGPRPDLPSLVAVRGLGPVGHRLGLDATHVPQLRAAVAGERCKHGAVWEHSDSACGGGVEGSCEWWELWVWSESCGCVPIDSILVIVDMSNQLAFWDPSG